jgi:hypothetical protein
MSSSMPLIRNLGPLAPGLTPPVTQPEDACLCIGRKLHDVGKRPLLALMEHGALDRALVANGALAGAARHARVDMPARRAPLVHRSWDCERFKQR